MSTLKSSYFKIFEFNNLEISSYFKIFEFNNLEIVIFQIKEFNNLEIVIFQIIELYIQARPLRVNPV